ncbi:hypothetical protein [Glaciimonas immobilis]|uniref:Uncharacterized protein n=1 Tax=Glaciimonas immobilis TaxID=728004 RepID=A0A840RZN2_9BURK|nr:hypothetical protein [Glaciimonas immobilis]KAF3998258.1 hypothetical protein HAV38_08605 [Glaciimonas immobilis]MBB5201870.1 hypothetical protein [Glaciimonas immobilis]
MFTSDFNVGLSDGFGNYSKLVRAQGGEAFEVKHGGSRPRIHRLRSVVPGAPIVMRNHLSAIAVDASIILLLLQQSQRLSRYHHH